MNGEPKMLTRSSIVNMGEMAHIKEALEATAQAHFNAGRPFDLWKPIRETPLKVIFDRTDDHSMENNRINPYLPQIWFQRYGMRVGDYAKTNPYIGGYQLRETVSIPNSLSALKIADEIIEGAEPWSDWKQYSRLIDMDVPRVNVPKTQYTDTVSGGKSGAQGIEVFKEGGGTPPAIGGKVETIELDTSGTNNSYRGTIAVNRNDVKDNNFLAVEQSLKNAGNMFYFNIGKFIIDQLVATTTTNTATKAALSAGAIDAEFESLIEVVRSRFPGTQRNRADTMFIHPADAARAVKSSTGAGGTYPFVSRFLVGPTDDKDIINNSGLAAALGLRNVWETPQITTGTVMITKRDVAQVVGLREDLTIENFDLSVGGLYESDLLVRFDVKQAFEDGAFKVTSFEA